MGAATGGAAPARGRPRSEKSRRAILTAAAGLLHDRPLADVTMDAIAERAGTSKATIYRWWASKEVLALDAVLAEWSTAGPIEVDEGNLRDDLRAIVLPWVRLLRRHPFGPVIAALTTEVQRGDPAFVATYHERFVGPRRASARAALERAVERGEAAADTNLELTLDLIYGPVYHRLLHLHAPVTERFAADVVDAVVRSVGASSASRRSSRRRSASS